MNQLMFNTSLENGVVHYIDSPLLRALKLGRLIVVDEADKAAEHVVAVFKSLAGQGELTLPDGRRVRRSRERESDIVVHPNFRLVLLANRPGYRMSHLPEPCHASHSPSQLSSETTSFRSLEIISAVMQSRIRIWPVSGSCCHNSRQSSAKIWSSASWQRSTISDKHTRPAP